MPTKYKVTPNSVVSVEIKLKNANHYTAQVTCCGKVYNFDPTNSKQQLDSSGSSLDGKELSVDATVYGNKTTTNKAILELILTGGCEELAFPVPIYSQSDKSARYKTEVLFESGECDEDK